MSHFDNLKRQYLKSSKNSNVHYFWSPGQGWMYKNRVTSKPVIQDTDIYYNGKSYRINGYKTSLLTLKPKITRTNPDTSNWKNITTDDLTKGLNVPKQSKTISFRDAFNQARNAGLSEFTWRGERKNTKIKGEENYTWDANTKKWVNPLASVKLTATSTTDNITPISVPRERVETPSFDYAANISGLLTNPNPNRYIRTATPTFVGQTNNNWLRDMFRDTFKTFNFG